MTVQVTLQLPDHLVEHAKQLGTATQRDLNTVLTDSLEMLWLPLNTTIGATTSQTQSVDTLPDKDLLALASIKMDPIQHQRLGELQAMGKTRELTLPERYELVALFQIYQLGLLHKSEALAEAVKRGIQVSLSQ
ncbi:hypothetical protein [Leptothoe spongobia]|uniref:Uncharacterized protein n=1 Tax=Leptothoe spongobia TAU-MAC 1115 TaxID=1967444 RepID=A0A947GIJ1_9CYAN|nr:hypothetical protein [Leptothoe spongobia]MBT9315298.1 hypothetical protein [Leptothoe spongobia TAU-MAC 1115]